MTEGYRAVQSTHAALNFIFEHPSRAGPWFYDSNYLVQLELKNEKQLKLLIRNCEKYGLAYTVFSEPDIGNQITAIAIEPSPITQKLVRKIPLLFKDKNNENETGEPDCPENTSNQSKSIQPDKKGVLQEGYR